MVAYCWRSGVIGFGRYAPRGALAIAKAPGRSLRNVICGVARHAYDGKLLLVPGVPEAETDIAALKALSAFQGRVVKAIAVPMTGGAS